MQRPSLQVNLYYITDREMAVVLGPLFAIFFIASFIFTAVFKIATTNTVQLATVHIPFFYVFAIFGRFHCVRTFAFPTHSERFLWRYTSLALTIPLHLSTTYWKILSWTKDDLNPIGCLQGSPSLLSRGFEHLGKQEGCPSRMPSGCTKHWGCRWERHNLCKICLCKKTLMRFCDAWVFFASGIVICST